MRDAGWLDASRLERDALYLGLLTAREVKPLSRLEYSISNNLYRILVEMGLKLARLTRRAQNGATVPHLVMSLDRRRIADYLAEFDGAVIVGNSPAVIRAEARHFGYPACCAESFSRRGYAPNDLEPADQRILFHHACAGCTETPPLLPAYRAACEESERLFRRQAHPKAPGACVNRAKGTNHDTGRSL